MPHSTRILSDISARTPSNNTDMFHIPKLSQNVIFQRSNRSDLMWRELKDLIETHMSDDSSKKRSLYLVAELQGCPVSKDENIDPISSKCGPVCKQGSTPLQAYDHEELKKSPAGTSDHNVQNNARNAAATPHKSYLKFTTVQDTLGQVVKEPLASDIPEKESNNGTDVLSADAPKTRRRQRRASVSTTVSQKSDGSPSKVRRTTRRGRSRDDSTMVPSVAEESVAINGADGSSVSCDVAESGISCSGSNGGVVKDGDTVCADVEPDSDSEEKDAGFIHWDPVAVPFKLVEGSNVETLEATAGSSDSLCKSSKAQDALGQVVKEPLASDIPEKESNNGTDVLSADAPKTRRRQRRASVSATVSQKSDGSPSKVRRTTRRGRSRDDSTMVPSVAEESMAISGADGSSVSCDVAESGISCSGSNGGVVKDGDTVCADVEPDSDSEEKDAGFIHWDPMAVPFKLVEGSNVETLEATAGSSDSLCKSSKAQDALGQVVKEPLASDIPEKESNNGTDVLSADAPKTRRRQRRASVSTTVSQKSDGSPSKVRRTTRRGRSRDDSTMVPSVAEVSMAINGADGSSVSCDVAESGISCSDSNGGVVKDGDTVCADVEPDSDSEEKDAGFIHWDPVAVPFKLVEGSNVETLEATTGYGDSTVKYVNEMTPMTLRKSPRKSSKAQDTLGQIVKVPLTSDIPEKGSNNGTDVLSADAPKTRRRQRRASVSATVSLRAGETNRVTTTTLPETSFSTEDGAKVDILRLERCSSTETAVEVAERSHFATPIKGTEAATYCDEDNSVGPSCIDQDIVSMVLSQSCNLSDMSIAKSSDVRRVRTMLHLRRAAKKVESNDTMEVLSNGSIMNSIGYTTLVAALSDVLARSSMTESDMAMSMYIFDDLQDSLLALTHDACKTIENDPSNESKKLRFVGLVGECVSPPNDRRPGSSRRFELLANQLIALIESIENIVRHEAQQMESGEKSNSAVLISYMRGSMASIANDHLLAARVLDACKEDVQITDGIAIRVTTTDVIKMAKTICAEFGLKYMSYSSVAKDSLPPREGAEFSIALLYNVQHKRTALRHRVTWVVTSVVRYYLRWFLDEPPFRAATVPLIGELPSLSCRSAVFNHLQFSASRVTSPPTASAVGNVMDMPLSSMVTLALQQVFVGLFECHKSIQHTNSRCTSIINYNINNFYEQLKQNAGEMERWAERHLSLIGVKNDKEILRCAQLVLAAERGREFLRNLFSLDVVCRVASTSSAWHIIEKYSSAILRHGLPEDHHFALLSCIGDLEEVLSVPFVNSDDIMNTLVSLTSCKRKQPKNKGSNLKRNDAELKEMIDLCPYVFNFPIVRAIEPPSVMRC